VDFLSGRLGQGPSQKVLDRTRLFHTDATLCGLSALALGANAPTLLRDEALEYPEVNGATVFGSSHLLKPEKAVVANVSAVREWDANGTNFGFNPILGHNAGEFGHNDFYPVVIAACQQQGLNGATALRAMVLLDEMRGRLAEVFSLNRCKIDHVVHGAIASAAVYAALMGATPEQIESAIGMFVAHAIPWRAIRAGHQLSDSKGASAAISAEFAVLCAERAMRGFVGPKDIFRNPESLFRQFVSTDGRSPFDLILSHSGEDFAVMGMHFKLGLYEHQSAGALQGVIDLLHTWPTLLQGDHIRKVVIRAYEPAFSIIGDSAKRDPQTRQSADHSMLYIVATVLRKAKESASLVASARSTDDVWKLLMLLPYDYNAEAIQNPVTRQLMECIVFEHGGPEYDAKYPDGIPTSVSITDTDEKTYESGLVMYPAGHARNQTADLADVLRAKFMLLARLSTPEGQRPAERVDHLEKLGDMNIAELLNIYNLPFARHEGVD
jgi:2-methylcitrate dehydratase